jgi:UDP-N-acetylglucosamine 2-epimerase (non-hydrolysing)
MASSIAGFYSGALVCHVEAGLRTFNKRAPFPEEVNRNITGRVADFHFAPTKIAKQNLLNETVNPKSVFITGNTVIDALQASVKRLDSYENEEISYLKKRLDTNKKLVLVTGHRRENHGAGFIRICNALKEIADNNADVQIVYPVHLNPKVLKPVHEILDEVSNIDLIKPLSYPSFVWLMNQSHLIITDSGGVQEEAPSLGKPVLVMRETTERPEAVDAGTVILVGTDTQKIVSEAQSLLDNSDRYNKMSQLHNPYGDGTASKQIVTIIEKL